MVYYYWDLKTYSSNPVSLYTLQLVTGHGKSLLDIVVKKLSSCENVEIVFNLGDFG